MKFLVTKCSRLWCIVRESPDNHGWSAQWLPPLQRFVVLEDHGYLVPVPSHQPASSAPIHFSIPHPDLTISRLQVLKDLNHLISFAICLWVGEFPFLAKWKAIHERLFKLGSSLQSKANRGEINSLTPTRPRKLSGALHSNQGSTLVHVKSKSRCYSWFWTNAKCFSRVFTISFPSESHCKMTFIE